MFILSVNQSINQSVSQSVSQSNYHFMASQQELNCWIFVGCKLAGEWTVTLLEINLVVFYDHYSRLVISSALTLACFRQ